MAKTALTMTEIAKELGLSRNAISAVINNRADKFGLSRATVERTLAYIEECGYVQSKHALQIKGVCANESVNLLYCGEFPQYSHLQEALSYLCNAIEDKYGAVEITGMSRSRIREAVKDQVSKGVRRMVWIMTRSTQEEVSNARLLLPLLERIEHVVLYNFYPSDGGAGWWEDEYLRKGMHLVGFDRVPTWERTAELLWSLGHRRVAMNEVSFNDGGEYAGGQGLLTGIFLERGFKVYGLRPEGGEYMTEDQLSPLMAGNLRDLCRRGVSCAYIRNDSLALKVMFQLEKRGVRVPEDIGVIGYGGLSLGRMLAKPLTTSRPPVAEMCEKVMELIDLPGGSAGQRHYYVDEWLDGMTHAAVDKIKVF